MTPTACSTSSRIFNIIWGGMEAKGVRAELATARAAAQRDPTAKPITVPQDRKIQIKQHAAHAQYGMGIINKTNSTLVLPFASSAQWNLLAGCFD